MEKKFIIRWENKYSHEIGYVGKILKSKGHFVNADKENARTFNSLKRIKDSIRDLNKMGEGVNNEFHIVEVEDTES